MMSGCKKNEYSNGVIVTAGSAYLDIDAYACCVALAELICVKGGNAIAYSCAPYNYSICESLVKNGQIQNKLPSEYQHEKVTYIIVDVSDPKYIEQTVPLNKITEIYDHHTGFECYWKNCLGNNSHIEFLGAAATLIYREWKESCLQNKMSRSTALLLIAAILDNTLNLTSLNTTNEDIETFQELCNTENIDEEWISSYFLEVQKNVESNLEVALLNDTKTIFNNSVLPSCIAQLTVWKITSIIDRLQEIRCWFNSRWDKWMINIIDVQHSCSYFICDDVIHQKKIENVFDVAFESGVAKTAVPYLRKELIKKTN